MRAGRVLYVAVIPEWQGKGIGRQLLHQALVTGNQLGWQALSIGPVPTTAPAVAFLERRGAYACQSYRLYQRDL
jgi:GNAT superfamily N-acetyltransferase